MNFCVCVCFRRTKNNTTLLNEEEFVIFTSQFLWETICFKYNILYAVDAVEVVVFMTLYGLREMANSKS